MTNGTRLAAGAALATLVLAAWPAGWDALAGVSVHGALTQEQQVAAGETYSGTITLVNTGDRQEPVKIYGTDYLFYRDGTSNYGEPGGHARSNAGWLTFEPHQILIPAGATALVSYTVAVPGDQTLAGTYWSVLMIEVPGNSGLASSDDGGSHLGIRQVLRYGVQVVTNIEDSGERQLDFVETKLLRDGKLRTLQLDLENNGQRWLRPALWTELYDRDGNCIGKFDGGALRTYPGTSVRFRIDLSTVRPGEYKAVAIADCGADDIFGAAYTLRFEDENLTRSQ